MKRAILVALVCLCGVASAQPTPIYWRPPTGCSSGQAIVWSGSAWTCGSVLSTAGAGMTSGGSTINVVGATGGGISVLADSIGLLTSCSSGQILKWGGSAWACDDDATVGSGSVTGTGTANVISKWTSSSNQGDSLLSDNATTLAYATNKFTVAAASGNATVAGTFDAGGAVTDTGNRVFSVAGAGLTSSGATVNVIAGTGITVGANDVAVDTSTIQARVTGTCTLPNSVRAIASDGTVTCTTSSLDTSNVAGTSGKSARFTASNTVGNGALTDDGTNATIAGTFGVTGLLTATAGGTTPANWTTTGTGSVVSANDVTAADDITATDALASATLNVGGVGDTRSLDVDSGGTLTTRFDDNSLARQVLINNRGITAAGNGTGIMFSLAAGAGTAVNAVTLDALAENTTHTGASADGTFSLKTALNGTLVERLRCDSTGLCNVPGSLTVNGTSVNTFTTANTIPKGNGSGLTTSDITSTGTVNTFGDSDTDAQVLRGIVWSQKTGVDSDALIRITNDARVWNLEVQGSQSDRFAIVDSTGGVTPLTIAAGGAATFGFAASVNGNLIAGDGTADRTTLTGASAGISNPANGVLDVYDATSAALGVGGQIVFRGNYTGTSSTQYAAISAYKESATVDGSQYGSALVFNTRTQGGNNTEKMRIANDGALTIVGAISDSDSQVIIDDQLRVQNSMSVQDAITDYDSAEVKIDDDLWVTGKVLSEAQLNDHTRGFEIFEEFLSIPNSVTTAYTSLDSGFRWVGGYAAGGAESNRPGLVSLRAYTSSDTIGGAAAPRNARVVKGGPFSTSDTTTYGRGWFAGGGTTKVAGEFQIVGVTSPPVDDSDSYTFHIGLMDTNTATGATSDFVPNGIYCRVGTASSNIQVCTSKADTQSCTDTSPAIAIAEDKWYRCAFTVNTDGTSVSFTVSNVTDATSGTATRTTQIPNTSSNECGLGASVDSIDVAGTGHVLVDYLWMDQTFTTAR